MNYTFTRQDLASLRLLRAEQDLEAARAEQTAHPCPDHEMLVTLAECEYDEACEYYTRLTGHAPAEE